MVNEEELKIMKEVAVEKGDFKELTRLKKIQEMQNGKYKIKKKRGRPPKEEPNLIENKNPKKLIKKIMYFCPHCNGEVNK